MASSVFGFGVFLLIVWLVLTLVHVALTFAGVLFWIGIVAVIIAIALHFLGPRSPGPRAGI